MKKNIAGQAVGCQMISATDGSAFTGSVTVSVTGDAGTQATGSVGSGACTHEGNGYHTYAPAQAETNYDLVAFTFTGTGAIPATVQIYTRPATGLLAPATAGRTVVVDAAGLVDANCVKLGPSGSGTAQTARDIGTSVLLSSGTGTGQVSLSSGAVIVQAGTGTGQLDFTSGVVKANVTQYGGSAGTFASGRPEVNVTHIKGTSSAGTAGYAGIDWSAVNAPTSTVGLTGTTISTGQTITSVSGAVGSVTGNVGGNVTGSVGSVATGGITAASIAADAIGASELAADAVAEIADAVWDELVSGHLVDGSFGAYMNGLAVTSGDLFLATSSTARLNQSTASANNYAYEGCWLVITAGPGAGQARLIYQYIGTSKQCLITPDWTTTPDGTSNYVVIPAGAINSVYGAVGSVTGAVATVTALGTQAKADVNAEVVDALTTDTYAEPGQGAPAATLSLAGKIGYLFKAWRNKSTQTSTAYNLYNDDAATVDQKATTSDDGTVFTRGEVSTGP